MAQLISVCVGLPRDIEWRGRTVHTGIWKEPVAGRRRARRLNIDGDGQGDLGGHGGEQRAVFVYQVESYHYWQQRLKRHFTHGQFGENFTVAGLADDEVCIGDRYRIGTALFEVSQPRVTCYRVGIRTNEPRMAALLTGSGRPGFYLRVLEEGEVEAGDSILTVSRGPERMSVADINALLYSAPHPRDQLERALRIPALSPGWRWSFEQLMRSEVAHPGATGNAGLVPAALAASAAPGFRQLRVTGITHECEDVISLSMESSDEARLTKPLAGQFVVLRLRPHPDQPLLFRSYSLSGPPAAQRYRISVKIEPYGAAGRYMQDSVRTGDMLGVSEPRGAFALQPGLTPVVLLSAGIGITPLLSMLHTLASAASPREVWWLHSARNGKLHSFASEVRQLMRALSCSRSHIWYSRPSGEDRLGHDYDTAGRLNAKALQHLCVPQDADFYLCGPPGFVTDLTEGLKAWHVATERVHSETFSGGPSLTPGLVAGPARTPHQPAVISAEGPQVSFARSGLTVRWRSLQDCSLLELAEACDVPVRWSCRTGVCHNCESGLISGSVDYATDPLEPAAKGNVLLCCTRPKGDVVLDL